MALVIPLPGPQDRLEGGHAVWFTRADTRERLIKFQNSWSEQWGDHGFGHLDRLRALVEPLTAGLKVCGPPAFPGAPLARLVAA